MANIYSYDDFVKAAQGAGLWGQFSDADLRLAQQNPDFGYYALNAKQQYANAQTPEARALINADLEAQRRSLGGYYGGTDGSGYNPVLAMPNSTGNSAIDAKTAQYNNYPSFSYAPVDDVTGKYRDIYDQQLQSVYDYEPFSYDPNTDPLYGYYKQAYNREGQRATADTIGQLAGATGGIPSSYAATAAAQAGNYYAAQLADKIPDLYQLAYQQYADQYNRNVQNAGLAGNRYGIALDQFNTDRNFAYNNYADDFNRIGAQLGLLTEQDNTAYQRNQTAMNDARSRIEAFLAAGGDINNLPADLRAASGLSDAELNTLALYAASRASGRYYGRDVEEDTGNEAVDTARRLVRAYLANGGTIDGIPEDNLRLSGYTKRELMDFINTAGDTGSGNNIYAVIRQLQAGGASNAEIAKVIAGASGLTPNQKSELLKKYLPDYSIPGAR